MAIMHFPFLSFKLKLNIYFININLRLNKLKAMFIYIIIKGKLP